ncbi:hypothetical protein NP603_19850 [Methylomonas sp. SURF-1]|uniref:GAF domain-containing protein n=1 Tax=Methylomonas aurea TaxID=2952224 RepID=A0ABT1UMB2_9GAMM|nr:hypothetical protein [Methylomonas sp. SURF-1]MCQ8183376.1 hypothetical protein [Methylomonas sp. SURF-1]
MNNELNELQEELRRRRDASEASHAVYVARLHEQAEKVYAAIALACAAGNYVWAHKDNGRILKMGALGPRKGTRFPYTLGHHVSYDIHQDAFEDCELLVIDRFDLHPR